MVARLGFSVAVYLDPEILLIDEILSVGDLHFQAKCRGKLDEFKKQEVTIVLVSHSVGEIRRLCDRVIWLGGGRKVEDGEPNFVLNRYEEAVSLCSEKGTK
jgi:ABC-type polysaccharide/polyol phosphate transport system ATPase subunit